MRVREDLGKNLGENLGEPPPVLAIHNTRNKNEQHLFAQARVHD